VADREQVEAVAARVLERHPRLGLLVNNAGIAGRADFLTAEPERIEAVLRTNYLGSVWTTRAFLPGLGEGAHVANVVSVAGTVALAPSGPYAASKHAQLAFSRALAATLSRRGVQVHTVLPGFVETEGFPQRQVLRGPLYRLVARPELVAERLVEAVEKGRGEIYVPRWYRLFAILQVVLPGPVARVLARQPARQG
jgi:NAD(P)-dependent dehydrogenase (short-subunit alcohol dehydrogenase family)